MSSSQISAKPSAAAMIKAVLPSAAPCLVCAITEPRFVKRSGLALGPLVQQKFHPCRIAKHCGLVQFALTKMVIDIIDTALPEYSVTIIDRQVASFHAGAITNAGVQEEGKCQSCSWRKQQAVSVPPCTHSLDALHMHMCVCV